MNGEGWVDRAAIKKDEKSAGEGSSAAATEKGEKQA
jgi:hypothetical protein